MSTNEPQTQNADVDAQTIHRAGDQIDDWKLRVRDGDVLCIRQIPYDGQLIISTEDLRNRSDKRSMYRLSVDAVVAHYAREVFDADPRAFAELLVRTQEALEAQR